MKKFWLQFGIFLAIQAGIFAALLAHYNLDKERNYLAATIDKHRRLDNTPSPKIIVIGGSNVPFGVNSDILERELKMPVVNMGLTASLGLDLMLNEVWDRIGKGDVVVMSLEYHQFSAGFDRKTVQQLLEYRPASVRYLNWTHWKKIMIPHGLSLLGGIARRSLGWSGHAVNTINDGDDSYSRDGFNAAGSLVRHYERPARPALKGPDDTSMSRENLHASWVPSSEVLKRLEKFGKHCQDCGASFVYSCPPYPEAMVEAQKDSIFKNLELLRAVPTIEIVDRPEDYAYGGWAFYDSVYHLHAEGAKDRSTKMAKALKAWLARGNTRHTGQ